MSNELPPDTARRLMALTKCPTSKLYDYQNALTVEDLAALEACCPDTLQGTCIILDDAVTSVTGFIAAHVLVEFLGDFTVETGTYDHYERAGWVNREEPEPEEWGPWVKLATIGERPDGLLDEERVDLQDHDGHTIAIRAYGSWATATHYRRKRIRCIVKADHDFVNFIWAEHREHPPRDLMPCHYALRGTTWTPATVPEVTAAKAGRDPNGVIAWHGGECPVGENTKGFAHFRGGACSSRGNLHSCDWPWRDDCGDIIAYEVTA